MSQQHQTLPNNQFLSLARSLTEEKQFIMDVLCDNTYTTYLVNGDSICRRLWSTPIRIDPPMKLRNQLLTIYKMMYTRDFNEINLGARVYLKRSDLHYLYRGTCRKDRSENMIEFHVERGDDVKCSWVNRNELDYWCKPIYSHCWENDERIELYHVFGKKVYEFSVPGEKQTLVVGSFYYNVGEFIQLIEEIPKIIVDKNVKTVVVNFRKPNVSDSFSPARKKQKVQSASPSQVVVKTVIAKPLSPNNTLVTTIFEAVKEGDQVMETEPVQVVVSEPAMIMNEATLIEVLKEKRINFKHVIPFISEDEDLLRSLISNIGLIMDHQGLNNVVKIHTSKKDKALSSEVNTELIHSIADAMLSREIDFTNTFFTLLDMDEIELCKQIVMCLGRLESYESILCLERHKIFIDSLYASMNKTFTDCVRMILALEERMVDDENSRVKTLGNLFSISEEVTLRIVEDRNVHSHAQLKRQRLKGALEDRVQYLKQIKASYLTKKKSAKKVQAINVLIQSAMDQFPKCK